jgi:hypothetical protein
VDVPVGTSGVFVVPNELLGTSRGVSVTVDGKKAAIASNNGIPLTGGKHALVVVARD